MARLFVAIADGIDGQSGPDDNARRMTDLLKSNANKPMLGIIAASTVLSAWLTHLQYAYFNTGMNDWMVASHRPITWIGRENLTDSVKGTLKM